MSGSAFVLVCLFFMRLPDLGSYRCCGLPVVWHAWGKYPPATHGVTKTQGDRDLGRRTHAAIHAFKFFEQQIFISWICVPAMTTLRTNKAFVIHLPYQRRCLLLAFNLLPYNVVADMRSKPILCRIGKQKLVG
ncbi:MAG: hypothetical protein WBQ24_16780 [Xanthobacteraceae bacterium]